ncbi:phosphoglycolate phosphatase [Sphingomonas sp. SRS2]|uniref:phosphoglycolate phosphatase n=1 Tax=Sphingomonas sp. SRS2 TaxID=133190 RepID=UPI000A6B9344|nr:phosphoglycolate phosphatase [Sphingomonas sp. SRS2]
MTADFPFDVVAFDLDGTLADTAPDLTAALNHALGALGRPPVPAEDVRHMVGHGARALLQKGLAATGEMTEGLVEQGFPIFIDYYLAHIADGTTIFPGLNAALDQLAARGVKLAVCTNKAEGLARRCIEELGWADRFDALIGGDTLPVRKPDPAPLFEAIARCGGGRAAYVGDSITDTDTGRNANIPTIAVSFGFSDRPVEQLDATALIDHFNDLIPTLERLGQAESWLRCNICGSTSFVARQKRGHVQCAGCDSNERARLIWLMLETHGLLRPGLRVLHLAPERAFAERLSALYGEGYEPVDYDPELYDYVPDIRKIDLVEDAARLPSGYYDLIIHSHVMEHIPCNITAILYHLHRSLKPHGKQVCCVPIIRDGHYAEDLGPITPEDATARFGQDDHVRTFGGNDIQRTLGMLFKLPDAYDLTRDFDEATLIGLNIPRINWRGWSPNSILVLEKGDLLLTP